MSCHTIDRRRPVDAFPLENGHETRVRSLIELPVDQQVGQEVGHPFQLEGLEDVDDGLFVAEQVIDHPAFADEVAAFLLFPCRCTTRQQPTLRFGLRVTGN